MADIVMPQLGESVTEGTITRWFKSPGDTVTEDEPLFEVSTDKVDTEVPATQSGTLGEIRIQEGETVDVGTVLAVMADGSDAGGGDEAAVAEAPATEEASAPTPEAPEPSEAPVQPAPAPEPAPQPAPTPETAPTPEPEPAPETAPTPGPEPAPATAPTPAPTPAEPAAASAGGGGGALLSPLVRRLIDENGLDPSSIAGTGVGGRITRDDVLKAIDSQASGGAARTAPAAPAAAAPAAPRPTPSVSPMRPGAGDQVEPLNKIRRLTGDHMVMSRATSPHVITVVQVDYEAVERARRPLRSDFKSQEGFSLTYLAFIARAVIDALSEFPHMNASVDDGNLVIHHEVHLSIAVDLDFQGLLAPVVHDAHDKRLRAIARDINDLATRARAKQLAPDELGGGTFTLSNSGSYGTFIVAPIINQPQVAILSTDGVSRQPVVVTDDFGNESIAVHSVGNLTLAWDHRAFDGAYAAAFMARVKEILETRDWTAEV